MRYLLLPPVIFLLSACVQPPKPLRGEFANISPKAYQQNPQADLAVRWTGFVVDVDNHANSSCLIVRAKVPNEMAKPSYRYRVDQGRFIACKPTFLEPASFINKPVTVTGKARRLVHKKIDEYDYAYPLVDAAVIFVW